MKNSDLIDKIFPPATLSILDIPTTDIPAFQTYIIEDITTMINQSELTEHLNNMLNMSIDSMKSYTPTGFEELASRYNIGMNARSDILRIVLRLNDVFRNVNTMLSFESTLPRLIFDGLNMNMKRSYEKSTTHQGFSPCERVMIHMYVLFDILLHQKKDELLNFIVKVDKLCRKTPLYTIFHDMYHMSNLPEDLKVCILDTYMFILMIGNIVFGDKYPNDHIELSPFVETCADASCKMIKWANPWLISTIIRNGIYLNRLYRNNAFDMNIHRYFVQTHGGRLLNICSQMFLSKANYDILYDLIVIYSMIAPSEEGSVQIDSNNRMTVYANDGSTVKFPVVGDLAFPSMNYVLMTICDNPDEYVTMKGGYAGTTGPTIQIIEKQTDGYVYYSLNSKRELNYDKVVYFDDMQPLQGGRDRCRNGCIKCPTTRGGVVAGQNKFNGYQMGTFEELVTMAVCAFVIYVIVSVLYKQYQQSKENVARVEPNIKPGSVDTGQARVHGTLNPMVPTETMAEDIVV